MRYLLAICLILAVTAPVAAQHHRHQAEGAEAGHAPYAGMERRAIKALSAAEVGDLRAGKGMGMALPAELNGYPGPAHVLQLADRLGLTPAQRATTEAQFAEMRKRARDLGAALIAAETSLDGLFARRAATIETVTAATAEAAALRGRLRATHLSYHLRMMEVLSAEQVAAYNRLRGYGG